MDYRNASATDLAVDEYFIQWVKKPTAESNLFWEQWLQDNPDRQEEVQEARQLVLMLSKDEDDLYKSELDTIWLHLQAARDSESKSHDTGAGETNVIPISYWRQRSMWAAASVSVLLLLAAFFAFGLLGRSEMAYATAYGEKRTVHLPDSSVVVLNSNSSIIYSDTWLGLGPRKVNLRGEAYFAVTHKVNNRKFVVLTTDGTEVEVLGTEFDVSSRGGSSRVVLASGKVRLSYDQDKKEKQLVMAPGDLVELSGNNITKKQVKPELYTAWKDNKVIFENTSLREIATMVQEVYGHPVVLKDAALADLKLTAYLDDRGLENILATLSETLDVTITRQDQEIWITSTKQ
jgi:ferric-dicitrate binding protein FerR (iron transport regulator)